MRIIYDQSFNSNEWFVIVTLLAGIMIMLLLPRVLTALEAVSSFLYGVFWGMFFDHTLSVPPWDFYDVNDRSNYQLMDFLSYLSYGPFSYIFIYFYVRLKIKGFIKTFSYVLLWEFFSLITEKISVFVRLFHFEKGYESYWSPAIYLFTQLVQLAIFSIYLRFKHNGSTDMKLQTK